VQICQAIEVQMYRFASTIPSDLYVGNYGTSANVLKSAMP